MMIRKIKMKKTLQMNKEKRQEKKKDQDSQDLEKN
jgi:hypothetical protein